MTEFKTIAVAGASGNIGAPLVSALKAAGFTISAITREGSKSTFPSYVKVLPVDYSSVSSITKALAGQDAVVSCVGSFALASQAKLVEGAAAAGVKRFLPAEYGADTLNVKTREFPILKDKVDVQELLKRKSAETGMSYTLLFTGLFLDWGLEGDMIVDIRGGKARLYDGGDRVVSFTTTTTIGKAITQILLKPAETKNRGVYVQDIATTQNAIVKIARKVDPGKEWQLSHADTAELERQAEEAFKAGNPDMMAMVGSVFRMYFGGKEYGSPFSKLDNELLGIEGMGEAQVEALVKDIMTKGT